MTPSAPEASADAAEELLLATLRGAPGGALFATELAAQARAAGFPADAYEPTLAALERDGRALVAPHTPPDVHLRGTDLRVAAAVEPGSPDAVERARVAAEACWDDFVRAFLASHRCG
ncbi:MAG TPA: hypothetical protein VFG31_08135 [Conexibacter sp.]|nr:hypothetical protein [Conexibacter sp.]